jgi:spore cortex formation protein SpoVR/YcgB (stage V sporulation)
MAREVDRETFFKTEERVALSEIEDRDEACCFHPQGQAKIMNEGWATYLAGARTRTLRT